MNARDRILARLRTSLEGTTALADDYDEALVTEPWRYAPERRIARLREMLEAVHGETVLTTAAQWPERVLEALAARAIEELLVAPESAHGRQLAAHLAEAGGALRLKAYDRPVEAWKDALFFHTPASLTGTLGAIAATGSLVLWPTPQEPRLMSLVPPLHIALLKASEVHDNLYEAMRAQGWTEGLPTNALLVSGPSKTADIQQTLAYGAHGPKELLVLILEDA
ncbi:LutC/YkgG family protein [Thauera aromatica]|uniref:LutC/YkgG family protein n=1 Tax=Thauera aromatica TaxID=59405 RepID=UPI001FFC9551|nr:lactate utilization protein [Thauera aromatica]MCK2096110.1 lactate utilization protein [Thauera aromatica]